MLLERKIEEERYAHSDRAGNLLNDSIDYCDLTCCFVFMCTLAESVDGRLSVFKCVLHE